MADTSAPATDAPAKAAEKKVCNVCGAAATMTEPAGGPFSPADYCSKHAPKPAAKRR